MDSHNIARGRESIKEALALIKAKTLIVAISSDILFPVSESEVLKEGITNSELTIIDSLYGHDGFLIETDQLIKEFKKFYKQEDIVKRLKIAV